MFNDSTKRTSIIFFSLGLFLIPCFLLIFMANYGPIYALTEKTAVFIPEQTVPNNLSSLRASECGECHQAIYREWQSSMHSKAYTSPFFQAYHQKDKHDPSCLVCHTPLQNQLVKKITYENENYYRPIQSDNPKFDSALQQEGVSCSVCHVRDGFVLGPFRAEQMNAPHPVKYDASFKSKQLCLQCHQVPSKPFSLTRTGVCSTGEEFTGSHWEKKGYRCQHCHMEKLQRSLVDGFPKRETRMHNWPGGYSSEQLQKAFSFSAQRSNTGIRLVISNSGAGHKVPTGDPDRFIDLVFFWKSPSATSEELYSVRFKRQIVWQPIMFEWSDNRLAAGESLDVDVVMPASVQKMGELWVEGTYHIMTDWSLKRLENKFSLKDAPDIHRPFLNKKIIISAGANTYKNNQQEKH